MNNADKLVALVNPTKALLAWFKRMYLNDALRPAGGTRVRGSAHPKLPPCGRAAGTAKNLRVTAREPTEPDSLKILVPGKKPFRRQYPKGPRGRSSCMCGSGKQWRDCHMRAASA